MAVTRGFFICANSSFDTGDIRIQGYGESLLPKRVTSRRVRSSRWMAGRRVTAHRPQMLGPSHSATAGSCLQDPQRKARPRNRGWGAGDLEGRTASGHCGYHYGRWVSGRPEPGGDDDCVPSAAGLFACEVKRVVNGDLETGKVFYVPGRHC